MAYLYQKSKRQKTEAKGAMRRHSVISIWDLFSFLWRGSYTNHSASICFSRINSGQSQRGCGMLCLSLDFVSQITMPLRDAERIHRCLEFFSSFFLTFFRLGSFEFLHYPFLCSFCQLSSHTQLIIDTQFWLSTI